MNLIMVFSQILTLFILIATGYILKRLEILNTEVTKKLSQLLVNFSLPLLIINSFKLEFSEDILVNAGIILLCSFFIHLFMIVLGKFIYFRYEPQKRSVLRFTTVFANTSFVGYPIILSIFGKVGIFYASIYDIFFSLIVYTYSAIIYAEKNREGTLKNAFINPGVISVIIGILIFIFNINLPAPIENAMNLMGSLTTPLAMLIIGSFLYETKLKEVFLNFSNYHGVFIRLLFIPIMVFLVLRLFGVNGIILSICTILTAMPAAASTTAFAEKYKGDSLFASKITVLSTMLCIVTIPIILLLLYKVK